MRHVGIDEAGYGPNLGPLVMTAVTADGPTDEPFDLWSAYRATVCRAGGDRRLLWVDDSKLVHRGSNGLDRLEAAALAALAACSGGPPPANLAAFLDCVGAGSMDEVELTGWLDGSEPPAPRAEAGPLVALACATRHFDGSPWRLASIRSVVVGPARFNVELERTGNKARVHAGAFSRLLSDIWAGAAGDVHVRCDKHGGRNDYYAMVVGACGGAWVDRRVEGAELSRYEARDAGRRLDVSFAPRSDAGDGLVALASIVSKYVRERWMAAFNAFWAARLPGLRPTAGYPTDAARFREAIAGEAERLGRAPQTWWRSR